MRGTADAAELACERCNSRVIGCSGELSADAGKLPRLQAHILLRVPFNHNIIVFIDMPGMQTKSQCLAWTVAEAEARPDHSGLRPEFARGRVVFAHFRSRGRSNTR